MVPAPRQFGTAAFGQSFSSCASIPGYKLELYEIEQLLDQVDTAHSGQVARSQLAASQMDWQATQQNHAEQWLASVHKVFQSFDTDADGVIAYEQIVQCLRSSLPASEVHTFALMGAQCHFSPAVRAL